MSRTKAETDAQPEEISDADLAQIVGGAGKTEAKPPTLPKETGVGAGLGAGKAEFDDFYRGGVGNCRDTKGITEGCIHLGGPNGQDTHQQGHRLSGKVEEAR